MKKLVLAAVLAAFSTGASVAGGLVTPVEPPVMAPAPATGPDWTGPYIGAYYGLASGEMFDIGGPYVLNNYGSFYGGFAGYRHDFGNFVIGAEA